MTLEPGHGKFTNHRALRLPEKNLKDLITSQYYKDVFFIRLHHRMNEICM